MSERYDVATRFAEGQSALEHTRTYVEACHALGYQQPDLTAHPAQVGEWYGTEAGLDLRVLDADAAELRVALTAIEEALWVQRTQVTELTAGWRGSGAESAVRFLQSHCDTAEEVLAHVRAAAEQCATLRDDLWRTVDGKVATTVAIDDRSVAHRAVWLAAAQAVTAGAGDRSASELVVHQQVMPFVENDIRYDWLAAISTANASVAASYDTAIHALSSAGDVHFDIPGDLGPRWQPVTEQRAAAEVAPAMVPPTGSFSVPTVPAAAPATASMPTASMSPAPMSPAPMSPATPAADEVDDAVATPLDDLAGLSSGAGGLGGLGGMTGGVGGIFGSIAGVVGSLLGSLVGGTGGGPGIGDDPIGLDDADGRLVDDVDTPNDTEAAATLGNGIDPDPSAAESSTEPHESAAEPTSLSVEPPPAEAPLSEAPPEEAAPPDAAPPQPGGPTPCEIAEDQLPQVGQ